MRPSIRSVLTRYGMAVLAAAGAVVVRLLLDPLLGNSLPLLLACLAVVVTAWYGGFGPSLVALLLGLLSAAYFFLPPRHDLAASLDDQDLRVGGFLFLGVIIGLFSEGMRAARRRAEANADEAVRRRRELEEEVVRRKRLAEELAEADRRKDEFLAMLGHELRNPLAPIRTAVHLLRDLDPADPRVPAARDVIERQVGQMARLVDDLLDVSRISRGKITLNLEVVELADVIARAVETSRPHVDARRQKLTVALPPGPVRLRADLTRLAQVVSNLLNNAAKFTGAGGHIGLTVEAGPGQVAIRVRDDGVGMTADLLPRVFDLFTQGDRSLARSEGGLGIGLTLVKNLVEIHGGTVEAHSDGPGKGSEFVVQLPALPEGAGPVAAGGKGPPERRASPRRRVLVVDDNTDSADSLAVLLKVAGHEVRTAYEGPAALRAAAAFRPEVVLLDIGLPRMDGYAVARRLREEVGLKAALVALTGYGQDEDRCRSQEAGFDAHLVKPVEPAELLALVATLPVR